MAAIAGLVVVTAWTGVYYAAFTLLLGAAALLWRFTKGTPWRSLLSDSTPFIAIAVLAIVGFLPSLATTFSDPPIGMLSDRLPYDSVVFAGYLAVLVLPIPASSLPGFDAYNRSVTEAIAAGGWVESSAQSNYGTWVTSAALLTLIGGLIARSRRKRHPSTQHKNEPRSRYLVSADFLAYLILICALFFIPWGLNYLFAGTVTAQIRAWNRLTPIMLLLFLLGAAAILQKTRIARQPLPALTVCGIVLALTFVDAVLPFRQAYADNAKKGAEITKAGRDYAIAVNSAIPESCGVLQLPTMGYPEFGVIGDVNDYDHFWTSITNPNKRWSYGAVKATDAHVWAGQLPPIPTDEQISLMRRADFCAIHVDGRAWRDEERPTVLQEMRSRFGDPIATGYDGDWSMFDIRDIPPASVPDAENFFHQPMISADPVTTHALESDGTQAWWWTKNQESTFTLTPTREETPVSIVRGWVAAPSCGPRPITITLRTGSGETTQNLIALPDQPTYFEITPDKPSDSPATLEVVSNGSACEAEDFAGKRFAQLGNLQTY
jgi:phosphoglycerol transferase